MLLIRIGIANCAVQATIMSENYQVSIKWTQIIFYCSRIFSLFWNGWVQSSGRVLRGDSTSRAVRISSVSRTYGSPPHTAVPVDALADPGFLSHFRRAETLPRQVPCWQYFLQTSEEKRVGNFSKCQSYKHTHTNLSGPKLTDSCYENLPLSRSTPRLVRGNRYSSVKVDGSVHDRWGPHAKMKNALQLWPRIPTYRNYPKEIIQ